MLSYVPATEIERAKKQQLGFSHPTETVDNESGLGGSLIVRGCSNRDGSGERGPEQCRSSDNYEIKSLAIG